MTHWNDHARQWQHIGSPLRPAEADIAMATTWIQAAAAQHERPLSVLLLGVTPELVTLSWPVGTRLFVADNNLDMIKTVLPAGALATKPRAVAACWQALALTTSSIDLVIGDGCYNVLVAADYDALNREISRVLTPAGHFIMRMFIRPEHHETLEELQHDVMSGVIKNFHVFKWRLAMALHGRLEQGVCLRDIWSTWHEKFAKNQPWPDAAVQTINNYQNVNTHYTFPTLSEARQKLKHFFHEQQIFFPAYPLGERCPSWQFIRKPLQS